MTPGDPFEFAASMPERFAILFHETVLRLYNAPECEFCGRQYVHAIDCLDRMNRVRTPTGDWWKL